MKWLWLATKLMDFVVLENRCKKQTSLCHLVFVKTRGFIVVIDHKHKQQVWKCVPRSPTQQSNKNQISKAWFTIIIGFGYNTIIHQKSCNFLIMVATMISEDVGYLWNSKNEHTIHENISFHEKYVLSSLLGECIKK